MGFHGVLRVGVPSLGVPGVDAVQRGGGAQFWGARGVHRAGVPSLGVPGLGAQWGAQFGGAQFGGAQSGGAVGGPRRGYTV